MGKQPSTGNVGTIPEALLHPAVRKAMELNRAGRQVKLSREDHLRWEWDSHTIRDVTCFLETGNLDVLRELLWESPDAMAHPVVFWQVFHLRKLARMTDEHQLRRMQLDGASIDPEEPILPTNVRQAAKDVLKQSLEAWVRSMLPGFTLEPVRPTKRKGAKPKMGYGEDFALLSEFHDLLAELNNPKQFQEDCFERKTTETKKVFVQRTIKLIQRVHASHWRSSIGGVPESKALKAKKSEFTLEDLRGIHTQKAPLPTDVAEKIAKHAITKKGKVSKRPLLHALFAYYERKTPEAIRGIIERAEGDYPQFSFLAHRRQ